MAGFECKELAMLMKLNRLSFVAQNLILGSITGIIVGFNLRILFLRAGAEHISWLIFFVIGPAIGFLSGKERERYHQLKEEKHNLQQDLEEISSALKKSKEKYSLLVESASDAIFLTTMDGRFLIANEATCLLSGYARTALKALFLKNLQVHKKEDNGKHSWSDNGCCRCQEKWRSKTGDIIQLEVNRKLIQFSGHRLLLHVARDMASRGQIGGEARIKSLRRSHENRIKRTAAICQTLCRYADKTVSGQDTDSINGNQKISNGSIQDISGIGDAGRILEYIRAKTSRDTSIHPSVWDLNTILRQEIQYLSIANPFPNFKISLRYTPLKTTVHGSGIYFSFTLGNILKAVLESKKSEGDDELSVTSRCIGENIRITIPVSSDLRFLRKLSGIMDPLFDLESLDGEQGDGLEICRSVMNDLGGKIYITPLEEGKAAVHLEYPLHQKKTNPLKRKRIALKENDDQSRISVP
jgi:PAS domain S-box-containing protein